MNAFKKIVSTRRFKYGIISLLFGIAGFYIISSSFESVDKRWNEIKADARYEKEYWDKASSEEREKLMKDKMAARIQLAQIDYGIYFIYAILAVGAVLTTLSFVPFKNKMDQIMDETENE